MLTEEESHKKLPIVILQSLSSCVCDPSSVKDDKLYENKKSQTPTKIGIWNF